MRVMNVNARKERALIFLGFFNAREMEVNRSQGEVVKHGRLLSTRRGCD